MKTFVRTVVALVAICAASAGALAGADVAEEYEVKAAMYMNLLRLVDWPAGKHGDPAAPLVIGVIGSEDMARALEATAHSKSYSASRRVAVKRIAGIGGVEECHTLFIGGSDRKKIAPALAAASQESILTVGESEGFMTMGGMIDLALKDDRVQIEVNLDLTHKAGLQIGSQVLKIALVRNGGEK